MDAFALEMKEAALTYLDRSGGLRKFIADCKDYNADLKQGLAVYNFTILVNPSDLIETDARLGNYLLHEPLKAAYYFRSVCFISIKTLSLIEKVHTEAQVNIILKLTHLPPLPNYHLDLCDYPRQYGLRRNFVIEGLVITLTPVTKYTRGARFLCTEETCQFSSGFHCIRVHIPGATESATVRNDFTCSLCCSSLKEDVMFRVLGNKQLVEIIHVKAVNVLRCQSVRPFRFQSITVFLRDELCNQMKFGKMYSIIGMPAHVHKLPKVKLRIEANSVQPLIPKCLSSISNNLKCLHSVCASSPWRLSAVLAYSFGSCIVPPGMYITLKFCLLLSAVLISNKEECLKFLDVLALTCDTITVGRLLEYCLDFVPYGIKHLISGEIFARVSKDEHGIGTASIEAGSALLASDGICFLGDLSLYKKDKLELLCSALETRTTAVYISGRKYGDVDQQLVFPLTCNFWALADVTYSSKKPLKSNSLIQGREDFLSIPCNIIESFGLLIHCQESAGDFQVQCVVQHTLKAAMDSEECLYPESIQIPMHEYKALLANSRSLQVEQSCEAERLIHGYYLASRRVRTDPTSGSKLSTASVRLLTSIAEAHAKLCLRKKVLEEDAVIAVILFENSLSLKYGTSALLVPHNALFPFEVYNQDTLHQRDLYLTECHHQILNYVQTFAPGAANYFSEE
ncbi:minichromosome maintenance domain-containing protein 2 [Polypterus senegalus]|uniref:minichromosome maintenance domain-containing protein 2 n=1 Tax=Polypterus senegalus TaxID=55291 RepID=UPI001966411D|nr:minichromosome maintenance domain-containing protein 2 [Polypterus senegalus]